MAPARTGSSVARTKMCGCNIRAGWGKSRCPDKSRTLLTGSIDTTSWCAKDIAVLTVARTRTQHSRQRSPHIPFHRLRTPWVQHKPRRPSGSATAVPLTQHRRQSDCLRHRQRTPGPRRWRVLPTTWEKDAQTSISPVLSPDRSP